MANRWSINCRLVVLQLVIAALLIYLRNISSLMKLEHQRSVADADNVNRPQPTTLKTRRHHPESIAQLLADMLLCPHNRRPTNSISDQSPWQLANHQTGSIYVLSAVFDDRKYKGGSMLPAVDIVVLGEGIDDATVYCQIWFSKVDEPCVVKADVTEVGSTVDQQNYRQYLLTCTMPVRDIPAPDQVSLVTGTVCQVASLSINVDHASGQLTGEFGVCVLPSARTADVLTGPTDAELESAPWLVEWLEHHLMFGASQTFVYAAFDDQLSPLAEFYSNRKLLVVRRIAHPSSSRVSVRSLAAADCLLRSARRFRFVSVVDIDELIVPRQKNFNYSQLFTRFDSTPSGAYSFRVLPFAMDSPANDTLMPSFLTTIRFRSRELPIDSEMRSFVDPDRCHVASLLTTGNCNENEPLVDVPLHIGATHRYRACAQEVCDEQRKLQQDRAMFRFQLQIKQRIVQSLKDSGLVDPSGLYRIALLL